MTSQKTDWLPAYLSKYRDEIIEKRLGRGGVSQLTGLSHKQARRLLSAIRETHPFEPNNHATVDPGPMHYEPEDLLEPQNQVDKSEDLNSVNITMPKGKYLIGEEQVIKTAAQLIQVAEINEDEFFIDGVDTKAYTTPVKVKHYNGINKVEGMHVELVQNHYVSLKARRKVLERQQFPYIAPVEISLPKPKLRAHPQRKLKRALVIPDSQNGYDRDEATGILKPYHDRRAWSLAIQLAGAYQPDVIVLLGDHLDLAEWSDKFVRTPEMQRTTQAALIELGWTLGQLRNAAPDAEIIWLEGNHDKRMTTAILNNMKAAAGLKPIDDLEGEDLISIPRLLTLEKLGINYIPNYPNGEYWLNDSIRFIHGELAKSQSGDTTRALRKSARVTTIQGHIHRTESSSETVWGRYGRETHTMLSFGCICHIDGRVPGVRERQNWQQGLGVIDYDDLEHYPQPLYIESGKTYFEGRFYEGHDFTTELNASIKAWQF